MWKGPGAVSDEERSEYAKRLIKACREKGIDAIAVTDHHDFLFCKYVRAAAKAETDDEGNQVPLSDRIVVFPGIELTLNVPCQTIVIFDSELPDDLFPLVLNALAIIPTSESEAKVANVRRLEQITTLEDLRKELDKYEYLRNRYIILPNVSEGGNDTLLKHGSNQKYASMPCVGGYIDGSIDKLGDGKKRILAGKEAQYGNKKIAVLQTSDSRSADHTTLGNPSTWIKWSVPTAEALRQACLAQESRIALSAPTIPSVIITTLSVSNSAFLGPINVSFNPQFNALIGGRGTGKSTILEYLRWGLCDQPPTLSESEDLPNFQSRRNALIEKTLRSVNANVEVTFVVNGITHVVRRFSENSTVHLKVGDSQFSACRDSDIRQILPIQGYSQKQLSNVSVRVDELSRFIESPVRAELDNIDREFDRTAAEIREEYAALIRKRSLEHQLSKDKLQLISLEDQASNIRDSISGLSEADGEVLSAKPLFDDRDEIVRGISSDLAAVHETVLALEGGLAKLPTPFAVDIAKTPKPEIVTELVHEFSKLVEAAKDRAQQLRKTIGYGIAGDGTTAGKIGGLINVLDSDKRHFEEQYESAKSKSQVHESRIQELTKLEKLVSEVKQRVTSTQRQISSIGTPETKWANLRQTWKELHARTSQLLLKECTNLTDQSKKHIRAELQVGSGLNEIEQGLKEAATGTGIRREKIDSLVVVLKEADDPYLEWEKRLTELEALATLDLSSDSERPLPNCPLLLTTFSGQDLRKLAAKISPDTWLRLALLRMHDRPKFEFQIRENDYIPFENASAGQQATALLRTLLNQPGPPLIIDQPEEDLDNPVVLEIVREIWKAKETRQLIFASHNANLVVNGDAELVIWCENRTAADHSKGEIRDQGAIDMAPICDAIKAVMEGGETAFKLRRDKYGF